MVHERRAKVPRELEGKYPNTREPHTHVIVQIPRRNQLMHPIVEIGELGMTSSRRFVESAPGSTFCHALKFIRTRCKGPPDTRITVQRPLPIRSPHNLLDKFFSDPEFGHGENVIENLLFGDESVAEVW